MPNKNTERLEFGLGDGETGVFEVRPSIIRQETEWLETTFADQLAKLRKAYGEDNVFTCWGFLAKQS